MPAVAVVGAAVAIGVAVEVGTTFAIIAAVGATIGAVGAVTGVKELQIAGAVIGAAGAIGGLASSAGLIGNLGTATGSASSAVVEGVTAAETASPFMSAGDSIAAEIAHWSTYGESVANPVLSGAPTIGAEAVGDSVRDVVGSVTSNAAPPDAGLINTAEVNAVTPDVTPSVTQMNDPGGVQLTPEGLPIQGDNTPYMPEAVDPAATGSIYNQPTPPTTAAPAAPAPAAPAPPEVVVQATPPDVSVTGVPASTAPVPATPSAPLSTESLIAAGSGANTPGMTIARTAGAGSNSWFKDIMGFIGKPGVSTLMSGVVQAGGAFISGATSELTPAQVQALRAQADANTAAANLSRIQQQGVQAQQANMNAPLPVAVRRPPRGLINTPVTGAPA